MSEDDAFAKKCRIEQNELLGTHVVAAVDIKAGETLLLEQPLILLNFNDERRCANCYKKTETYCEKCRLFSICTECVTHNEFNCQTLAKAAEQVTKLQQHTSCLAILECLLLSINPDTKAQYERMLQMKAHLSLRRKMDIWREHQNNIVTPLLNANLADILGINKIDEELIQQLCGIIDVNCFEVRAPDEGILRAIYPRAALLAHNCVANCALAVDDAQQLKIYATKNINKDSLMYNCYVNVLLGTAERRESLRLGKCFDCQCARCLDPSELGSHMSSLICAVCQNQQREGFVMWQAAAKPPKWQCGSCEHVLARENVEKLLERAKEEIFHARDDIYHYEMLLARLARFLHPQHYVLIDLKQNIAAILRSIITNSAQPPGRKVFERKVRLCQEVLNCLCIIHPGISRMRAIAMYELSSSYAELCRLRLNASELTESELFEQLQRVEISYRESLRMLLYEPLESPEGRLTRSIMQELKELQQEMKQLQTQPQLEN